MGLQAEVSRAVLEEPPLCLPLLLLSGCFFQLLSPICIIFSHFELFPPSAGLSPRQSLSL